MGRRDKMKKSHMQYFFLIGMVSILLLISGCEKDSKKEVAEQFIRTQVSCATYIGADGDKEVLKNIFLDFFTEESYQKYLDDVVGYLYPQLFYMLSADQTNIKKIKCIEMKKNKDGTVTYDFEVNYILMNLDEEKKKTISKTKLKDYLKITLDNEAKITQVVILNTSDIIKKLFLDIKVQ